MLESAQLRTALHGTSKMVATRDRSSLRQPIYNKGRRLGYPARNSLNLTALQDMNSWVEGEETIVANGRPLSESEWVNYSVEVLANK